MPNPSHPVNTPPIPVPPIAPPPSEPQPPPIEEPNTTDVPDKKAPGAPAPDSIRVQPDGPAPGQTSGHQLPHERDESVNMTDNEPDPDMQQAYRDLKRGLQDTDRGKVADETYQKQKQ